MYCKNLTCSQIARESPNRAAPLFIGVDGFELRISDFLRISHFGFRISRSAGLCASRLLASVLFLLPFAVQAQFTYTTNNHTITITGYTGSGGAVTVPNTITGLPVTDIGSYAFEYSGVISVTLGANLVHIGDSAFYGCASLGSITIPDGVVSIGDLAFYSNVSLTSVTIGRSVTSLGNGAFEFCASLTGVYFRGNAPSLGGSEVFAADNNAVVYYLPGTTGWGPTYGGLPTALLASPVQAGGPGFGLRTNRFGFTLTGSSNISIVVEASTNLATGTWTALETGILSNGSSYFSDPEWTNYPARFYRIRLP